MITAGLTPMTDDQVTQFATAWTQARPAPYSWAVGAVDPDWMAVQAIALGGPPAAPSRTGYGTCEIVQAIFAAGIVTEAASAILWSGCTAVAHALGYNRALIVAGRALWPSLTKAGWINTGGSRAWLFESPRAAEQVPAPPHLAMPVPTSPMESLPLFA